MAADFLKERETFIEVDGEAYQAFRLTFLPEVPMSDMNVLLVQPESYPKSVTIGSDLESLQAAVGGSIEVVYPFEDSVGLIMNEEGKIEGLPLNRALRDDQGELYDIIAGDFLVVGLTEDDFGSLTPEQMDKFEKLIKIYRKEE